MQDAGKTEPTKSAMSNILCAHHKNAEDLRALRKTTENLARLLIGHISEADEAKTKSAAPDSIIGDLEQMNTIVCAEIGAINFVMNEMWATIRTDGYNMPLSKS